MRRILHSALAILVAASLLTPAALASIAPMAMGHACCHQSPHHVQNRDASGTPNQAATHQHCASEATETGISATSTCHDGHSCCLSTNLREPVRVAPTARPAGAAPVVEHPFLEEFFPSAALDSSADSQAPRAPPQDASR